MRDSLNIVSAEELFGEASRLVTNDGGAVVENIASLGWLYQIVVILLAMVYLFSVVKFSDVLFYIFSALFGGYKQHANDKVYSSVINNIELLMLISGVVLIGLGAMRFSITGDGAHLFTPLNLSSWGLFGAVAGGVLALILSEVVVLYLLRIFVQGGALWSELMMTKRTHLSAVVAAITPFLLVALLTQGVGATVAVGIAVVLCIISLIIFAKETFSLFILHKFSLFHWILYLCALEIFPLSLLLAPILRGRV